MIPRKNLRFKHTRVLDPQFWPERVPAIYQVTAIRRGLVYYRPVIERIQDGVVYREDLGTLTCCRLTEFSQYCLEVI